ncbi:unnamed protein product [Microthlaspi erraticum]|uniref:Uncharacterized protein n=1 Tax=Microthlaspi erraticum TaxID=1685480 RepID=A0A6D2KU05_9BRAS|nr:unnamed protein product [Microthlaspi erraticum]
MAEINRRKKEVDDVCGKEKESEPEKGLDSDRDGRRKKEVKVSIVWSLLLKAMWRKKERDEGKRQKREKLLEEANQPRVSTRVAGKIEKKAAEKVEKERKNAEEKLEEERKEEGRRKG